MIVIDTRADFVDWLGSQAWLADAFVDELAPCPPPAGQPTPERVRISLRLQVSGGLVAGERRRMRGLTIEAAGVAIYALPDGGFVEGNCCQGAELREDARMPIAFSMDVPAELCVECERIQVTEREWEEVVPAWFSQREFHAVVSGANLPEPADWVAAFADRGHRVAWRYCDGPATDPAQVTADYEGWYVQHADRVSAPRGGLFFCTARQSGPDFLLSVQDHADDDGVLWRACAAYIGTQRQVEVHCGNVVLSERAWREHLSQVRDQPNGD